MPSKAPTDAALLAFSVSYVHQHGTAKAMTVAAAVHFGVDQRTIYTGLARLRQQRKIGRGVFRTWRDGQQ